MKAGRTWFAAPLLAALFSLPVTATSAAATTWLVPGDGSNTCTVPSPNCDTIAQAVAASSNADTISIGAGSFPVAATLDLTKTLTITGANIASTTLAPGAGIVAFDIRADGIVIQDLTIQGGSIGARFPIASDDTEFARVAFDANTSRGIEIGTGPATPVTNVRVLDCTISGSSVGLRMSSESTVDGLSVSGTIFSGNAYGIYQANEGNSSTLTDFTVSNGTFIDNTNYGIYAEEMQDALIEDSSFTGGGTAIGILKFNSSNGQPISNITIRGNQFSAFTGNALDFEMLAMGLGSPLTLEDNTITKDVGIMTVGAAVFVRLHPTLANGAVNFVGNTISLTGTFGSGTAAHGVQLRGNGPVTFTSNVFDGNGVGGSGTTPPTSGIFIQSRSGSTIMPATTVISGTCNRIQGFHNGVSVFDSFAGAYGGLPSGATVSFEDNAIVGNDAAGAANGASPTLGFEDNWWGCADGPGNAGCDAIVGAVDADPAAAAPPTCVSCLLDADCDDGLFCTGAETCDGNNQCVSAGDPCTGGPACNDVCNEVADDCVAPDGTSCDDGQMCTIADTCSAGACVGDQMTCADGVTQGG
jgi:hypothetical protein